MRRLAYVLQYLGRPPWDTNVTPPELVEVVEKEGLPVGRALDLGCGTGTNVIYLARHGWQSTGVDFIPRAVRQARRKARRLGVGDRVAFYVHDVSRLDQLDLPAFDLVVDIGCLHSLPASQQASYAEGLRSVTRPGAIYLLYAWGPREGRSGLVGLTPEGVGALFGPHFRVVRVEHGLEVTNQSASAWYRLERVVER